MKCKRSFGVGDIVTPFMGFSSGYGYTRFYRVLAMGDKFFEGCPLNTDLSPLGNGSEQLSIIRFKLYRNEFHHAERPYRVVKYFVVAYSPYRENLQHKLYMIRCKYACGEYDNICSGLTISNSNRICALLNNDIRRV